MLVARSNPFGDLARLISEQFDFGAGGLSGLKSNLAITRATIGTVVDFEGLVKNCLSGEARHMGLRRVYNQCPTPSTSIAIAGNKTITASVGTWVFSMGAEATGTCLITFTGTATGSTGTLTAHATKRTSKTLTITGAGTIIATCTVAAAANVQFEDVTGQSNQNPAEYVSVGVLSTPFHGYGVDGVKYFNTTNGNTVASNVVTEAAGVTVEGLVTGSYTNTAAKIGLLVEEARTNLCLQSEDFSTTWGNVNSTETVNQITAPNGTTTADLITASAGAGQHSVYQDTAWVSGSTYATSVYAKPGANNFVAICVSDGTSQYVTQVFNLSNGSLGESVNSGSGDTNVSSSIAAVGNGWYRCVLVATVSAVALDRYLQFALATAATGNSFDGAGRPTFNAAGTETIYLWGAQQELGSAASTYIPTTTASVPRNADATSATHNPGAAFSVVVTFTPGDVSATRGVVGWDDGTANNRIELSTNASAAASLAIVSGGAGQTAPLTSGTLVNGTQAKVAFRVAANDVAMSVNGAAVVTDTTVTVPTVTTLRALVTQAAEYGNSHARKIDVYPMGLPDALLRALST